MTVRVCPGLPFCCRTGLPSEGRYRRRTRLVRVQSAAPFYAGLVQRKNPWPTPKRRGLNSFTRYHFMKPKKLEREKSIQLRQEGLSLLDISKQLGVCKGSVSIWVRGIRNNVVPTKEERLERGSKSTKTSLDKLMKSDFDTLSTDAKKRRVILEQDGKCFICGIDSWVGKPITLQVDHEDGDNSHNERDNLRGLCPNCHSQTPTYCGKKRNLGNQRIIRVTDERLLAALLESKSLSEALSKVGYSRQKHHFDRCKKLLEKYSSEKIIGRISSS